MTTSYLKTEVEPTSEISHVKYTSDNVQHNCGARKLDSHVICSIQSAPMIFDKVAQSHCKKGCIHIKYFDAA